MAPCSVLSQRNLGVGKGKGHQFLLQLGRGDDSIQEWTQTKDLTKEQEAVVIRYLQENPGNPVPRTLAVAVGAQAVPAVGADPPEAGVVDSPQVVTPPADGTAAVSSSPPHVGSHGEARYQNPFHNDDMDMDNQRQDMPLRASPHRMSQHKQPSFDYEQNEDIAMGDRVSPLNRNSGPPMGHIIGDLDDLTIDSKRDVRAWNGTVPNAGDDEAYDEDVEDYDDGYPDYHMESPARSQQYSHKISPENHSFPVFAAAGPFGDCGNVGTPPPHQKNRGLQNDLNRRSRHAQMYKQSQIRALPTPENSSPPGLTAPAPNSVPDGTSSPLNRPEGGAYIHPGRAHPTSWSNPSLGYLPVMQGSSETVPSLPPSPFQSAAATPTSQPQAATALGTLPEPERWTEFLAGLPSASAGAQNNPHQNNAAQSSRLFGGPRTQQPAKSSRGGSKHVRKSFFPQ